MVYVCRQPGSHVGRNGAALVFFTSDLHIGHRLVAGARLAGSYEHVDRDAVTEADIAEHNLILAEGWDELVGPDDIVWVLGDLSGGTKAAQEKALTWIGDRPGAKHLIVGNHDGEQ
jgi:calcineurin-like phosphoesterase family protein